MRQDLQEVITTLIFYVCLGTFLIISVLLKDGVILDEMKRNGDKEAFYQEILGRMADL